MKYDVVIVGGGFAGAYCGAALGRRLGDEGASRVALIAERNVLVFHPMLAEVVGSTLSPRDVVHPLREFCKKIDVLQGNVMRIDWASKTLVVDGGRFTRNHEIAFDHLVLAPGAITDLTRVPGMSAYGWPLRSVADALRLRAAILNRLEEANLTEDDAVRARLLTFVVVGGGFTGVETAGQIVDLLHDAKKNYVNLADAKPRVVLVHSGARLLPEIGERLGEYAAEALLRKGAEVLLNRRVNEATATKAILDDGTFVAANTVVATIGSAPSPLIASIASQLGLALDRGRLRVQPDLRVEGQTHLWAAGDCALIPWSDRGEMKSAPPTAQFALREGRVLGENLGAVLTGFHDAVKPFSYRYLGQLATIGDREAVAEILGLRFRGFIAWWMWRTIYLSKLPGLARKLRVVVDWTFELFFPRDISITQPPPDDLLRAIHLEADEVLVAGGDPVRGFYVVRSGALKREDTGEVVPTGTVVDDAFLAPGRRWVTTLRAASPSDIVVIRGKALELLSTDLRLVRRNAG